MTRLRYQPALDGVRAVAVVLVLLFHLGVPWMRAGYLGVSLFFTLSGFLISSLLLAEHSEQGSVSFRAFYARRARRLLPASLLVVAAVVVARLFGAFPDVPGLRADLLGALLQVHNWVQIAGSSSYGDLFSGAAAFVSPVEHFWSLAIEEQFYLLWPAVLVVLCRRRGGSRRPVLTLTLGSFALAPLIGLWFGPDVAYWSTVSRLAELLVGASVAVVLHSGVSVPNGLRHAAVPALGLVVACSALFPSGSGPAFSGWLWPFALVSGLLLLSLQVDGPVRRLLSMRAPVAVGKVSYGLYLVHWPVFTLMRQHGWALDRLGPAVLAVSITVAVTTASYVVLERPVRSANWSPRHTAAVASVAAVAVMAAALAVPVQRGFLEADDSTLDAASIDSGPPPESLLRATTTVAAEPDEPTTAGPITTESDIVEPASTTTLGQVVLPLPQSPNRPVRALVVGDSTAFYVGQGLAAWAVQHPQHAQVDLLWCQGCGFILDGTITSFDATAFVETSNRVVKEQMPETIDRVHPDVVVLMTTIDDVADRAWDMAEGILTPRDPLFRQRMRQQYERITRSVLEAGVPQVVWVVPPVPYSVFETPDLGESDRYAVQHDVIREVAADVGPEVVVCEMERWFVQAGLERDEEWRPDGTHLSERSASWLVERWLGPWLVSAVMGLPVE